MGFMKLITYQQGFVRVFKTLIPGGVGSWSGITKKKVEPADSLLDTWTQTPIDNRVIFQ
jgi:hypothetical protein